MTPSQKNPGAPNINNNFFINYFIYKPFSIVSGLFHKTYNGINYLFQKTNKLPPLVTFILKFYLVEGFKIILTDLSKESLSKTHQTALKIAILALNSSQVMLVISGIYKVIVRFRTPKPLAPSAPPPLSKKTFADMKGMDDLKERLQRVIKSWTCRADFKGYAILPTNGVLFYGPPGTGKTLAAECLAGEMKLAFYKFSLGDLSSKYVGETANNINLLFKQVKQKGGGVIFIDEIETLVKKRSHNNESYSSLENDKGVTEFLIQLQNASPTILVLAATNHLDNIDPAILRPGRFDLKIEIPLPDAQARTALLKHYLSKNDKIENIDESHYQKFGEDLKDYSSSDIQELAHAIAYLAWEDNKTNIDIHHIKTVLTQRGITINQDDIL